MSIYYLRDELESIFNENGIEIIWNENRNYRFSIEIPYLEDVIECDKLLDLLEYFNDVHENNEDERIEDICYCLEELVHTA